MEPMNKVAAFTAILMLLALTACNSKPSLVGKWKGQVQENGQQLDSTIEFKNDGKMVAQIAISGIEAEVTSSYTATDTNYTSTVEGFKIIKLPPELESNRSLMEASMTKEKGKKVTNPYKFKDNDTLEVTFEGGFNSTWTRVK